MADVVVETEQFNIQPQVDGSILVQPVIEETVVVEVGIPGPPGSPGEPGPPGPPGSAPDGAGRFVHEQQSASSDWLVTHNLGAFPSAVLVVDTAGTVVTTEVRFVDLNTIRILSSSPFSGKAYIGT